MQTNIFQELNLFEKSPQKLSSNFQEDLFPNIDHHQKSKSDPTPISDINSNSNSEIDDNSKYMIEDNPINQQKIKSHFFEKSTDKNKLNEITQSNPINKKTSADFINENIYGFKGRSPYANPNVNNMINLSNNNTGNNSKNNSNKSQKNNSKVNLNPLNKTQKKNEAALVTQLKDKILEYRCSICDFVATESIELHKHLSSKKHYTFPKKIKKNKKPKIFHKSDNKINQTFVYSMSKLSKKNFFCRHCGKKFDSFHGLNAHLNAHKYKCDICHKLFNSREELMRHNHNPNFYYDNKKISSFKKKEYKSPGKKAKTEIDDWEEISSNKKEKWESDEEITKNDFEQSYAFVEDSDENFDFNKMIKIKSKHI